MTIVNALPLAFANAGKSHLTSLDALSFYTENIIYPFHKTGYLIEEVYCTSPSVSIPWLMLSITIVSVTSLTIIIQMALEVSFTIVMCL
jgi:hypothetical protein